MDFFKRIDNYLLHHFPNIWVTKVHIFFPIAVLFMLLVYVINVFVIGYDLKDPLPEGEWGVVLMVIPVLVFIIYWFVIQARYNVEKSGGKLSMPLEYMNYFLYLLMFSVSYILVTFIPFTNDAKVGMTSSKTEIIQDINKLNLAHNLFYSGDALRMKDGRYTVYYANYVNSYYWYDNVFGYENYDYEYKDYYDKYINYEDFKIEKANKDKRDLFILATKDQLNEMAENYISTYNKYSHNQMIVSPNKIVTNKLIGFNENYDENYNYFNQTGNYNSRYSWRNTVDYKLERLASIKVRRSGALEANYFHAEGFKIVMSFLLMLALLVWIFKQIHWRDYLFGILAIALTPVLIGILGFIFFGIFRADEELAWFMLFSAYAVALIVVIKGYSSNYKSRFSIVTAMYLNIFLPFLPAFAMLCHHDIYRNYYYAYSSSEQFSFMFYSAVFVGILSIALFKTVYKKMRLLPNDK